VRRLTRPSLAGAVPAVLGAAVLAWLVALVAVWLPASGRVAALDVTTTTVAMLAGSCALLAAREPRNRRARRAFLFLGLGSLAWGLGNAVWTYYETVAGTGTPFPSAADVGYLTARLSGRVEMVALSILLVLVVTRSWYVARVGTREAQEQRALAVAADPTLSGPGHGPTGTAFLPRLVAELGLAGAGMYVLENGEIRPQAVVPARALGLELDLARETAEAGSTRVVRGDDVPEALRREGARSIVSVPVRAGGRSLGALQLFARRRKAFSARRVAFVERLAGQLAEQLLFARALTELERANADRHFSLEASRTGVCLFASGHPRFWNSAFVELLGLEPDDGVSWIGFLRRLDRAADMSEEFSFWTEDRRFLHVRFSAAGDGELLVSVDDLTDQERERTTRDRFVAEIVAAQERESRRVAELLHDDAVQQLTALALRMELAGLRSGDDTLTALARDASEVTASLRRLLVDLHPVVLESQGLAAAVDAASGSLRESGIEVHVSSGARRLPTELEQLAYRLVQEALANILRHSRAARAEVSIAESGDVLRCQVRDDGDGFDPDDLDSAVAGGHLGLHLVRERVGLAGGRFLIESRPGSGTTFSFELPIAHPAETRPPAMQEVAS
jgi:signal transduction histidine kinase